MKFVSLKGLVPYSEAVDLQHKWVEMRIADEVQDTVFFLEHEPVITRGRGLQRKAGESKHTPMPLDLPVGSGIDFCESERGGDLTYHGPGQLVVYPVFNIGKGQIIKDVHAYLRFLELSLIELLSLYEIRGRTIDGATGVWVGDRKIASIGIAVRKWVTYHGAALNVVNDLSPFQLFSPCGFDSEVMTSMKSLKDFVFNQFEASQWRNRIERAFSQSILKTLNLTNSPEIVEVAWTRFKDAPTLSF